MHTSRRRFLKNSSLLVAGTSLFSGKIFASAPPGELMGIQLYSIRDDMKKDPLDTLKKISKMGYRFVEHANYTDRNSMVILLLSLKKFFLTSA